MQQSLPSLSVFYVDYSQEQSFKAVWESGQKTYQNFYEGHYSCLPVVFTSAPKNGDNFDFGHVTNLQF